MDDLISRKNLLQNIVKRLGIASEDYFTAQESVVISCIYNEPSAQPEQKWIPCSERCPKENGYYLTSTINKEVYCDYWSYDHFDRTEAVVAWMKLPEPYAERRTDGSD